jgi:Sulfatase-modifying factor enzyme 1
MLTAICMVFERYRSLPDDRGRLCDLLIDDLCRSRRSEDRDRRWRLDETAKKDLLQRIALAMQQEGAQSWPVSRATEIALQTVPEAEALRQQRAKRYLDWAADHTGILRFQEAPRGEEQIRFWHRLFREYLSANRVAQEDTTAGAKIDGLWSTRRLIDPFWEDVVRLLPRSLGTIEKAGSMLQRLEELALANPNERGRLLGLAAAAIIENRDLFPIVAFSAMADSMAAIYNKEGLSWRLTDRLLFLDALGRLDPAAGDPRLKAMQWIPIPDTGAGPELGQGGQGTKEPNAKISLARWPVTVQEFRRFVESPRFGHFNKWELPTWLDRFIPNEQPPVHAATQEYLQRQYRYPNRPVVRVGLGAMIAFFNWLTAELNTGKTIRLLHYSEWERALPNEWRNLPVEAHHGRNGGSQRNRDRIIQERAIWGSGEAATINWTHAGINRPSPIGTFPPSACGAYDLLGNVWEASEPIQRSGRDDPTHLQVQGHSYADAGINRGYVAVIPLEMASGSSFLSDGLDVVGFRCAIVG